MLSINLDNIHAKLIKILTLYCSKKNPSFCERCLKPSTCIYISCIYKVLL
jgi:hypothetical protein